MPLSRGSSDKAREENIKREIAAGKPPKQAVAIGYSEQREAKAREHKNCMDDMKSINLESHPLLKRNIPRVKNPVD